LSEQVIASDIEDSLDRLGIACIPLYYLHRDDGKTPVEQIIGTLNRQIARGRLRHVAASNWSVRRIAEANAYAERQNLHGFVVSQVQGSLAEPTWQPAADPTMRFVTQEEIAWNAVSGVPLVAYSATAGGYFAGRGHDTGLYATDANQARCRRAVELAARRGCTPTQIALAYLMCREPIVIPLFSTTNPAHLQEALGAAAVPLDPQEVRWLRDG
jgi:aryl-alcohol dehydrogenase-like predicted oxidoreductase